MSHSICAMFHVIITTYRIPGVSISCLTADPMQGIFLSSFCSFNSDEHQAVIRNNYINDIDNAYINDIDNDSNNNVNSKKKIRQLC